MLTIYDLCVILIFSSKIMISKIPETLVDKNQVKPENKKLKSDESGTDLLKPQTKPVKTKLLDQKKMIAKLQVDETIELFCTNELKKTPSFSQNLLVLTSNLSFLLKLIALHVVLVGLPHSPILQLIILLTVELSYFTLSVLKYVQEKHLRSFFRFLLPKVSQSLILVIIEVILLYQAGSQVGDPLGRMSLKCQNTLVKLFYYFAMFEYLMLVVNIGLIIWEKYQIKKGVVKVQKRTFLEYLDEKAPSNGLGIIIPVKEVAKKAKKRRRKKKKFVEQKKEGKNSSTEQSNIENKAVKLDQELSIVKNKKVRSRKRRKKRKLKS